MEIFLEHKEVCLKNWQTYNFHITEKEIIGQPQRQEFEQNLTMTNIPFTNFTFEDWISLEIEIGLSFLLRRFHPPASDLCARILLKLNSAVTANAKIDFRRIL